MTKHLALMIAILAFTAIAYPQAKRDSRKPGAPIVAKPTPTPAPRNTSATPTTSSATDKTKRNERPATAAVTKADANPTLSGDIYRYEFTQPAFTVDRIVIEHDESGQGTIAFTKRSHDEEFREPLKVSDVTLTKLRESFEALDFLNTNEDYQFERDLSNMGNVAITLRKDGKERTAKFNWTSNRHAKILMDEYRRLATQAVWMFDVNIARENQPLETPRLVEALEGMLKRNEIADPQQMLPFLSALSNDERVPLIGRNRLGKIVKQIEKEKN